MQFVVARIGRAHGLRGDVTVEVRTDDPRRRLAPGAVLTTDPPDRGPLVVASGTEHSGRLLLHFEGVNERTAADALRGTLLVADVDPSESPEDPDDFYDHQLEDLEVVLADGSVLGRVEQMLHLPAQDLVVVRRRDGTELLVPFVAAIVPEVDLAGGRMVLDPPPGLVAPVEEDL